MRFMLEVRIPPDRGDAAVRDGSLGQTIQSILEEIKPEAAYFTEMDGARGGYIVVNIDEASEIPTIAEPLFLGLGAAVKMHAVMSPEDLANATPALEQAARNYA